MFGLEGLSTPENFFRKVLNKAIEINDGHLYKAADMGIKRIFQLRNLRNFIEKEWKFKVKFNTKENPADSRFNCILNIIYCFDTNFNAMDCENDKSLALDLLNFNLHTGLEDGEKCPKLTQTQLQNHANDPDKSLIGLGVQA